MRILPFLSLSLIAASSSAALANGFEAPVGTSARYAGVGGVSASNADRAEALFLNPAGLGRVQGFQVVLSAMPAYSRFAAPVSQPETSQSSKGQVAPLVELASAYAVADGLAFGLGVSVAGGLGADYGAVSVGPFAMDPEIGQAMGAFELSLGAGYALTRNFSVGASWRASYQRADMHTASPGPMGMLAALTVKGAEGTSFTGFRLGAQLHSEDGDHGVGVVVRTPVTWRLAGPGSMMLASADATLPAIDVGEVSTEMIFPLQVALGGHVALVEGVKAFVQYSFSDYSANASQTLTVGEMVNELRLDWNDRHAMHLGVEVTPLSGLALRGGYVFESAVTPKDRPTIYSTPSSVSTISVGAGLELGESWALDAALLGTFSSGRGDPTPGHPAMPGTYENTSLVGALSVQYRI